MASVDVEFVEGDVCGGDENLLHEGIDPLQHREIEDFGGLLVEIGHQFAVLRHRFRDYLTPPCVCRERESPRLFFAAELNSTLVKIDFLN